MTVGATEVIEACQQISRFSEDPTAITRTYLSPPTRQVHKYLKGWMDLLGMTSRVDAVGNLRGVYSGRNAGSSRLLIGSHIDTVPNGGAFDGVLGVVTALALLDSLDGEGLDYDVEVIAFSEEEGVRFHAPFIGSRALVGEVDDTLLQRTDAHGITMAQAIESFGLRLSEIPQAVMDSKTFAYVEFHIEQGPVLEALDTALGIVEAISGQSRHEVAFRGKANHAGTTPMDLRRDALTGAAEWILAVEREAIAIPGLVATVGRIEVAPGASNVVPGEARLSLDVRHAADPIRQAAVERLLATATAICSVRGLAFDAIEHLDQPATAMSPALTADLEDAARATGSRPHRMISGAGHYALQLAKKIPAGMLFLRSPGGLSHHPGETVLVEDVQAALGAGLYFLKHLDAAAIVSGKA